MAEPLRPDDSGINPQPARPTLEYGHATGGMSPGWQFCLGLVASTVSVLVLAIILPIALGMRGLIVGMVLAAGVMFAVGWRLRRGGAYRPMAAGIWTGIGVALLLDGMCWVALTGARIGG